MGGLSGPAFRWVRVAAAVPARAPVQSPAFRWLHGRVSGVAPVAIRPIVVSPAFRWLHGRVGAV